MRDPEARGTGGGRRPLRLLLALCGAAAVLAISACGGDDESEGGSGGGGSQAPTEKLTGTPIKAMTVASVNTEGPPFPAIPETAKLFEQWVNDNGGINGSPLEVITCDDRGVAPGATDCARQAVQEKVAAVVGSYTFMAEAIVPVLEKGDIAWFGTCCPGTPSELTSKASFPVGSGPLYSTGFTKRAIDDGCQKINAVIIDGAQPYIPLMQGAMDAAGRSFAKEPIILPATSQDYSPQVAEATGDGADCVLMVVSEGPYTAWMGPWAQSGTEARMYGPQGNLDASVDQGQRAGRRGLGHRGLLPGPVDGPVGRTSGPRSRPYDAAGRPRLQQPRGHGHVGRLRPRFTQDHRGQRHRRDHRQGVHGRRGGDVEPRPGRAWCRRWTSRRSGRTTRTTTGSSTAAWSSARSRTARSCR